jgi:phosphatidylserine decarboxylase
MRIAREGIPFIAGFIILAAAGALLGALPGGSAGWLSFALAIPGILLTAFSAWFFRDPERDIPAGPGTIVSPADGKVVSVVDAADGPSVAIFLNVFDVHVNRAPIAGRVESVQYRKGRFLAAFHERAGEENERNEIVLASAAGSVRVRQIAGLIARRIVCRVKPGDSVRAGERFGLIRFGSRTDLRLPAGSRIRVRVGERVRGGATIIGELPAAGNASGNEGR